MQRGARARVIGKAKRKRDLRSADVLSTSWYVELFLCIVLHVILEKMKQTL